MEQLYRDFTVCNRCGGRCYLGNDYCEDCANEMWQKLRDFIGSKLYMTMNEDLCEFGTSYELTLHKMKELEKEKVKSE